ncbi:RNase III inhibitor [Flammeovirgaceae bacterium 311]|nr:RNase III inhibitor [Flammeovirgaceae bacterium 311]
MARLVLIQGDITKQKADAIVNAANTSLQAGGGVDGAIHKVGGPSIQKACKAIIKKQGELKTGEAVLTTAGKLPARFVIHTAGPVWEGGDKGESRLLADCYRNSMFLAHEKLLKSVAFPNISTGVYGFPKEQAAEIALGIVRSLLEEEEAYNVEEVRFVCYDEENFKLYRQRMKGEMVDCG